MARFEKPMDPADVEAFDVRFRDQISGDTIAAIDGVAVDERSLGLGVTVGVDAKAPSIIADPETEEAATGVRFFLSVAEGKQGEAAYQIKGVTVKVTIKITTASAREIERTVDVIIRQLG